MSGKNKQHDNMNNTIMLIDDVPLHIRQYSRILQPLNLRIMLASNVFEACVMLQYDLPSAILFNHETVLDEYASFLKLFKGNPKLDHIMLIAIIHNHNEAIIRQIMDSGCDHFLLDSDMSSKQVLSHTIDKALRI